MISVDPPKRCLNRLREGGPPANLGRAKANHVWIDSGDETTFSIQRADGAQRLLEEVCGARPGHGAGFGHGLAKARPLDEVGDHIDGAIVLGEVADLQQARMRHLQRARFEQEPRANDVPIRLLVALEHPDRYLDAERAMGAGEDKAAETATAQQRTQLVLRKQAGFLRAVRLDGHHACRSPGPAVAGKCIDELRHRLPTHRRFLVEGAHHRVIHTGGKIAAAGRRTARDFASTPA